jgi:hypothetical protein
MLQALLTYRLDFLSIDVPKSMMGSKHASCKRPRVSRTARLSCACIVLLLWGTFLVDVVQATPPPEVCWPSMSGEVMQAACMAVCMAAYWRLRRHRRQQRGVDDDDDAGDAPLLPQGGRGGQRPRKGRGTARRHWLKGLDAWRLRSEEIHATSPSTPPAVVSPYSEAAKAAWTAQIFSARSQFQRPFLILLSGCPSGPKAFSTFLRGISL